jgi:hypothetical protein
MTSSRLEHATFQLVAKCLNQLRYKVYQKPDLHSATGCCNIVLCIRRLVGCKNEEKCEKTGLYRSGTSEIEVTNMGSLHRS